MADTKQLKKDLDFAEETTAGARATREDLRWSVKPGDRDREDEIDAQLRLIDKAMRPLRSVIGGLGWHPIPVAQERRLRAASADLQYERKQLKKMRRR